MAETEQAAEGTKAAAPEKALEGKDLLYDGVATMISDHTGKRVSRSFGEAIYKHCIGSSFNEAIASGGFRFPGGFGSLEVRDLQAGTKTLPSGQKVDVPARKKLRYNEGTAVKAGLTA